jgi:hypothetical protein
LFTFSRIVGQAAISIAHQHVMLGLRRHHQLLRRLISCLLGKSSPESLSAFPRFCAYFQRDLSQSGGCNFGSEIARERL